MPDADLLLANASEVATPLEAGPLAGPAQGAVEVLEDASVALKDGRVAALAPAGSLQGWDAERVVDCQGATVVPGFVDAHTHPVFAGERAGELVQKLEGASYQEILAQGGGIHSTVHATQEASSEDLEGLLLGRLDRLLAAGTTTLEAKSGYALTVSGELRLLRVLASADETHAVDLVPTLLGAHAIPSEVENRDTYVARVCEELTPKAASEGLARYCDAFVDEGAFTVDEGRAILEAGRASGLGVRIHADELACTRATQLGLELAAASIDHVNRLHDEDREAWSTRGQDGPVATLCPVTPFTSDVPYADARSLIEADIPVALGSDLNPNAWSEGMGLAIALAVHRMRMTPSEALVAATVNAAHSLGFSDRGRLVEGSIGDAVVLDVPSHTHLGYRLPSPPVRATVKAGELVA